MKGLITHQEDLSRKLTVELIHISDGLLETQYLNYIPNVGDWMPVGIDTYEVKRRIWKGEILQLMVEEPTL